MCPPIVVLVVVLNSQEGVGEDVYEGHSDGRTQPAERLELSIVNQNSSLPDMKLDVFGWERRRLCFNQI